MSVPRYGVVHRIDRDTSGALLVAKNNEAFDHAKKQFLERDVSKTYLAFVYGSLKEDKGEINRPIGRSRSDFRKWSAERGARGELREAQTDFVVLKRGKEATFVEVHPKTGRTHQIRVHFKAVGNPVVADKLYAPKKKPILGFSRLALHAGEIAFKNLRGEEITIKAPLPADFSHALEKLA
jgi:23S rRNA pseudouridine1911/1915/1917 synthase